MDPGKCAIRVGDVVVGRTQSISAEGLLVKLPQQDAPALLPRQVAYSGIAVGDEICDLLVVWLYPDGRGASVIVPEAAAEELVTGTAAPIEATTKAAENGSSAAVRNKGRWGAAASAPAEHASEPATERLMPFLVRAAEAPSYASVALVKPESTGSHRWTKKEVVPSDEGLEEDTYSKHQLLQMRDSLLLMQDAGESASSPLPTSMPCQEEDLDCSMLQMVVSTRQLPVWWTRCSKEAKRQAFKIACRTGRLRIVKAIYGAADLALDSDFLAETLKEMCGDAQSSEGVLLSRTEAQAMAAWGRPGGFSHAPAAQAAAWLVEHGAPVELLLPEAEGHEALSARLRGLGLLAEFGPAMIETSPERAAHLVDAVAGCLRDPEASGRKAAADALQRFGPAVAKASRAQPRLLRLVQKDNEITVRESASKALGCLGQDGLDAMLQLGGLEADHPEVQGLCALTIGNSGLAGAALADRLPDLLADTSDDELALQRRARVAEALGLRGELATEQHLAALALCLRRDPEQLVREACAGAVGQIGRSNKGLTTLARAALETGLEDPAAFVKEAASAALKTLPQLGAEDFDVPQSVWQ